MSDSMFPIKAGDTHEMKFPFRLMKVICTRETHNLWVPGCEVEEVGAYCTDRYFTAHGEGKVIYEVLSVAKMPGRYLDRIIFKRTCVDPDGVKNTPSVRMITSRGFMKDVQSGCPFRRDYEVEA